MLAIRQQRTVIPERGTQRRPSLRPAEGFPAPGVGRWTPAELPRVEEMRGRGRAAGAAESLGALPQRSGLPRGGLGDLQRVRLRAVDES